MWIRPGLLDLTYCTNIHAGESWAEVAASIGQYAVPLQKRLAGDDPFGLGLRLSAVAATALLCGTQLYDFNKFLTEHQLYVAVINGFPYGSFHGEVVKSEVFAPDWRDVARAKYTLDLAEILSSLLPAGMDGGISTLPLSYKPWIKRDLGVFWQEIVTNLVDVVYRLVEIRNEKGCMIHLDIEPEPNGLVENTSEVIAFFEGPLDQMGSKILAAKLGVTLDVARQYLREHVQVCFDTCHLSVEYEDPVESLHSLKDHGIGIGRIQISSALRVYLDGSQEVRARCVDQLARFADKTYLHQVIERRHDGSLRRFADLDEALAAAHNGEPREWRIHFHMPLFTSRYDSLLSTQEDNLRVLAEVADGHVSRHLEIETYTWDVLPDALKSDLLASIEREFRWVLDAVCIRQ